VQIGRFDIRFRYPNRCNVVTLDAELTPFLARELNHLGLENYLPSSRTVVIRPLFLFWLLVYLRRTARIAANLAAFIRSARIPILVTMDFLDIQIPTESYGVSLLEEVSRLVPEVEFVSIQHGQELRRLAATNTSIEAKRVTLLCFGEWTAKNFPEFGRLEHKYIPVGALVNSIYTRTRPPQIWRKNHIVVISTVKDEAWWGPVAGERRIGYEKLMVFVRDFCAKTSITPLVALTIDRDSNNSIDEATIERRWFMERVGEDIEFTDPSLIFGGLSHIDEHAIIPMSIKERFSSYFASDQSLVTIGMSSTALWEAFGRGNRILAVNLTDNPVYDFPISGVWSMRQPTYDEFETRLSEIMNMKDSEWTSLSKEAREFLIRDDINQSVADRIRSHVGALLDKHPWRKAPRTT